jgi:hypothetical protein
VVSPPSKLQTRSTPISEPQMAKCPSGVIAKAQIKCIGPWSMRRYLPLFKSHTRTV